MQHYASVVYAVIMSCDSLRVSVGHNDDNILAV